MKVDQIMSGMVKAKRRYFLCSLYSLVQMKYIRTIGKSMRPECFANRESDIAMPSKIPYFNFLSLVKRRITADEKKAINTST